MSEGASGRTQYSARDLHRYAEFLTQLGTLVPLDGADEQPHLFLNLEKGGKDGHYTYVWNDDIMQVTYQLVAGRAAPRHVSYGFITTWPLDVKFYYIKMLHIPVYILLNWPAFPTSRLCHRVLDVPTHC